MNKTKFIAVGDIFITRKLPQGGYEGFEAVRECICGHDVKFANLEMTFHNKEGYPAAFSGGTWAMTAPERLDDVKQYGFNLYNTANNHSCDYSHGGVLATIRNLKERGMIFAGTGGNLAEASAPCYLETRTARVALIGVSATFHDDGMAGGQNACLPGRPGLNPLRFRTVYHLSPENYRKLEELARVTKINAAMEREVSNGYANPPLPGTMPFGKHVFRLDESDWTESVPLEADMERIEAEILDAKRQADVMLVSFHAHTAAAEESNVPAMFLERFARQCIDAGADAVLGHGPHELRGIEIYKGRPIFYSLGNFIFETDTVLEQPWDACAGKGLPQDTKVGAYMDLRSKNDTAGYAAQPQIWQSVMAGWTMEGGRIVQIRLYPISLGMKKPRSQRGVPVLSRDEAVLEYLGRLSEPYDTRIRIANGCGYIDL